MNIEIANRLAELRKKNGLSQEELADKIGVSRQAVSKWETASASPDTDNLICLAKIYGVSLDDLLDTDQKVEDIARDKKEAGEGIHLVDDEGNEIHITSGHSKKDDDDDEDDDSPFHTHKKEDQIASIIWGISIGILGTIYIVLGFVLKTQTFGFLNFNAWQYFWLLFLFSFIPGEIYKTIALKDPSKFPMVFVVLDIYLVLGMTLGGWGLYWPLFLAIPVFYIFTDAIKKIINKK